MKKKHKEAVVIDAVFEPVGEQRAEATKAEAPEDKEILCGVVLQKCPVVSFNPFSNVLVYERDGQLIQTNAMVYDGSGFIEVE